MIDTPRTYEAKEDKTDTAKNVGSIIERSESVKFVPQIIRDNKTWKFYEKQTDNRYLQIEPMTRAVIPRGAILTIAPKDVLLCFNTGADYAAWRGERQTLDDGEMRRREVSKATTKRQLSAAQLAKQLPEFNPLTRSEGTGGIVNTAERAKEASEKNALMAVMVEDFVKNVLQPAINGGLLEGGLFGIFQLWWRAATKNNWITPLLDKFFVKYPTLLGTNREKFLQKYDELNYQYNELIVKVKNAKTPQERDKFLQKIYQATVGQQALSERALTDRNRSVAAPNINLLGAEGLNFLFGGIALFWIKTPFVRGRTTLDADALAEGLTGETMTSTHEKNQGAATDLKTLVLRRLNDRSLTLAEKQAIDEVIEQYDRAVGGSGWKLREGLEVAFSNAWQRNMEDEGKQAVDLLKKIERGLAPGSNVNSAIIVQQIRQFTALIEEENLRDAKGDETVANNLSANTRIAGENISTTLSTRAAIDVNGLDEKARPIYAVLSSFDTYSDIKSSLPIPMLIDPFVKGFYEIEKSFNEIESKVAYCNVLAKDNDPSLKNLKDWFQAASKSLGQENLIPMRGYQYEVSNDWAPDKYDRILPPLKSNGYGSPVPPEITSGSALADFVQGTGVRRPDGKVEWLQWAICRQFSSLMGTQFSSDDIYYALQSAEKTKMTNIINTAQNSLKLPSVNYDGEIWKTEIVKTIYVDGKKCNITYHFGIKDSCANLVFAGIDIDNPQGIPLVDIVKHFRIPASLVPQIQKQSKSPKTPDTPAPPPVAVVNTTTPGAMVAAPATMTAETIFLPTNIISAPLAVF